MLGILIDMNLALRDRVLPDQQRRTLAELSADLDLNEGDARSKRSAFWTMLTLSAVIASAGVISDSTATVIGAMIIAPLSTPIMGIALGVAKISSAAIRSSMRYTALGALLVVLIGAAVALILPGDLELLSNSQVTGRTSPGLLDLVAAVATGFAGAIALARKDVAAVLPGVAIAISLVPPLAVVGLCAGEAQFALAFGALILFLSNLVALVLAGSLVFATLGYGDGGASATSGSRRKAYLGIAITLILVIVPLVANTVGTYVISLLSHRVEVVAESWIEPVEGASISDVSVVGSTVSIEVQTPGPLPPVEPLRDSLDAVLPAGIDVRVTTSLGQSFDLGLTGT